MKKIIEFVKKELENDKSGHGIQHALRVFKNAKKILEQEKGDEKVVLTAALIHDTVDKKLFDNTQERLNLVTKFLKEEAYSGSEIDEILYIIQNISWNYGAYSDISDNLNAQIVRDADRLDAIGAIGIIRTIEFGTVHNRKFYSEENLKEIEGRFCFGDITNTTLSHFYEKLLLLKNHLHTKTAKKMAEKRHAFMESFLNEFYDEI